MKIAISAICKNEEKNIESWIKSFNKADDIVVCDTGSSDRTVEILKQNNIKVKERIFNPFYFDEARNYALSLIGEDIDWVICPDIDERLNNGWREDLEKIIKENPSATSIRCKTMVLESDGSWKEYKEGNKKIFKNKIYIWHQHIHEYPKCLINEKEIETDKIILYHYQSNCEEKDKKYTQMCIEEYNKDNKNYHVLWFVIQHYNRVKNWDEVIKYSQEYIKHAEYNNIDVSNACIIFSLALFNKQNPMCIKYAVKAIEINPSEEHLSFFINMALNMNYYEMVLFGISLSKYEKYKVLKKEIIQKMFILNQTI